MGATFEKRLERFLCEPATPYVLLAVITLLALMMRLYRLADWSIWIDEMYTLRDAQAALGRLTSNPPPTFVLIGILLKFVQPTEWNLRIIPALIGVLTLPVLFFPVRKLFGPVVALLAMLFLALSPWHLHWSQNARFYTGLALFYTLAILYFYFGVEENRRLYILFSVGFLALATMERKMALFYVPVVVTYLVLANWLPVGGRRVTLSRRVLISLTVPVALFGVYEFIAVVFAKKPVFYAKFIEMIVGYDQNPVRLLLAVVADVGLPLFVFALAGGAFLLYKRQRSGLFLLIGALLPIAAIVAMAPFAQAFSRYVFHMLPTFAILAAVAVKELWERTPRDARILSLAVVLLLVAEPISQDVVYYTLQHGNRQNWRTAFEVVRTRMEPGDQVVTTRVEVGEWYMAWKYGQPDYGVVWTQGTDPKHILAANRPTWFVIDDRTGFISPKLQEWLGTETHLVSVNDVYVLGKPMKMRVYYWDPADQAPEQRQPVGLTPAGVAPAAPGSVPATNPICTAGVDEADGENPARGEVAGTPIYALP